MKLEKLATEAVVVLDVGDSLNTAVQHMWKLNVRHLPVVDGGIPVGMVSDRDVLFHVCQVEDPAKEGQISGASRIDQVMTRPLISLSPEDPVEKAARLMLQKRISAIPLSAAGGIVGIVTETDLLKCYNDEHCLVPGPRCREGGVVDLMAAHVFSLTPRDATLAAIRLMREKQVRHVPVVEGDRLVGILSDRDVLRGAALDRGKKPITVAEVRAPLHLQVRGIMTTDAESIGMDATLSEAAGIMVAHKFGALPVIRDNKLAGILTETDLLRALVMDCEGQPSA